jgi:hypothetical protein
LASPLAGGGNEIAQPLAVPLDDQVLKVVQRGVQPLGLSDDCGAIGQQHVGPQVWVAGRDAGAVTKTRPAQCEVLFALGLRHQAVHDREGQHMREVTDGGQRLVVQIGREFAHPAT